MAEDRSKPKEPSGDGSPRRSFIARSSALAMSASLAAGYGLFAVMAGRFLYPARGQRKQWTFVAEVGRMQEGDSLLFRGPSGETINIARQGRAGDEGDFIALSSTCPHLGCQVHWEAHNDRFFCPCHNGQFNASGKGVGGPPGEAGMSLPSYPLKIEEGLLYIEVPVESLSAGKAEGELIEKVDGIHAPGHDPCLAARRHGKDPVA